MIHGKDVPTTDLWKSIKALTAYAVELNRIVESNAGFQPFGDMRGAVGRKGGQHLNKATTRWLLKGMGFSVS